MKEEPITYELVEQCLYNFLGYGNLDSKVWFIGTEEGGAEIWRFPMLSLPDSLRLRTQYELAMDFKEVWEDLYGIQLTSFKGPATWRFMAAFLLAFEDVYPTSSKVQDYVFVNHQLGRKVGDHFLCEYLPLPKPSKDKIQPYENIWHTYRSYKDEVGTRRLELITKTLNECINVKLVISYERELTDLFVKAFRSRMINEWKRNKQTYKLWELELDNKRKIFLLQTPFFGQGQISYEGIWEISKELEVIMR